MNCNRMKSLCVRWSRFEMTGTIFDIQHNSYVDGPGIRTTVFFKGCNLHCAWCHNPESQNPQPTMMVFPNLCTGCGKCKTVCSYHLEKCDLCGRCALLCPHNARKICGRESTVEKITEEIVKDRDFYENSGGGVTFSGGECMLQVDFLCELLKKCKENGIRTAVDTAGKVGYSSFEKILPYTDLFLYDIKTMNSEKHRKYTGVGNERILDNLSGLLATDADVLVRVPIITGVNDTEDEMAQIKSFLDRHRAGVPVELLPYHKLGINKGLAIGNEQTVFEVPSETSMQKLYSVFR